MLGVLPATEVQRRCDRKKLRFAPPSPRDTLVNSAMPKPAPQTFAFEPEHIEAMRKAFERDISGDAMRPWIVGGVSATVVAGPISTTASAPPSPRSSTTTGAAPTTQAPENQ